MSTGASSVLVEHFSASDFEMTMQRLTEAIGGAGMTIFARIDHAAAARAVGLHMPPTVVLFFGNPKGGTPVMLASTQSGAGSALEDIGARGRGWDSRSGVPSDRPASP